MVRTSPCYYIDPTAINVTPNANGSASDLAVYVLRGVKISVFSKGIAELGMEDATWRQWTLRGRNRRLSDSSKPYTIYARLLKTDTSDGYLIFAPKVADGDEWIDKYAYVTMTGLAKDTANENNDNYWYVKIGEVSQPDGGSRTVSLDTGILGTDQFNAEWNLDPDDMPLRVELSATIDGDDAGDKPYVPWGKELILRAKLVEGWTDTDVERFHHWTIQRSTGDADSDTAWNYPNSDSENPKPSSGRQMYGGNIALSHARGVGDVFNGTVSSTWTVIAWGLKESDSSSSSSSSSSAVDETSDSSSSSSSSADAAVYEPLAQGTINILAETVEQYALELSSNVVNYDPTTDTYNPIEGVDVVVRATDQRGEVFKLTKAQLESASLIVQYSVAGLDQWTTCNFTGADEALATTNIPIEAFHLQQNVNVIIVKVKTATAAGESSDSLASSGMPSNSSSSAGSSSSNAGDTTYTEIYRTPIAFVRNGEDTKEREWIYLRSAKALSFNANPTGDNESLLPALINGGEVNPEEAAAGLDENRNQDGWVPEGWWDEAQGTGEDYHYEYAAFRDYIKNSLSSSGSGADSDSSSSSPDATERGGYWGDFSTPRIWSYYAEDAVTYRCRWTQKGVEIYQLKCAYTGAYRGELPLVATLMKRVGSGQEQEVKGSAVIILSCEGVDYSKTINADSPTITISEDEDENNDFVQYLNDVALNGLSITFTIDGEAHAFSIPVIREADEDSVKSTVKDVGKDIFLSKTSDDTAQGVITFLKGLLLGDGSYGVTEQGAATLASILSGKWSISQEGVATLAEAVAEYMHSEDWKQGYFDGAGFGAYKEDGTGLAVVETDKLYVRRKAVFAELEIRKLSYVGGDQVHSFAGSTIRKVVPVDSTLTKLDDDSTDTPHAYKCYFDDDDGTTRTENWWEVGDQARCQTFNIEAGTHDNVGNKYYWRLVIATGTEDVEMQDGTTKTMGYVILSNKGSDSPFTLVDPSTGENYKDANGNDIVFIGMDDTTNNYSGNRGDAPAEEDKIVQLGSQRDASRGYAYIIYVTEQRRVDYAGISSYNLSDHEVAQYSPKGSFAYSDSFELRSGSPGDGNWHPMANYRGDYSDDVSYSWYDEVAYDGSMYVHTGTETTIGIAPGSDEDDGVWTIVVAGYNDSCDAEMVITTDGDWFLDFGESCTLTCKVMQGNRDLTEKVKQWTVERDTGDSVDDAAWQDKDKVKNFAGTLLLVSSSAEDDLGSAESKAVFTFTAFDSSNAVMAKRRIVFK